MSVGRLCRGAVVAAAAVALTAAVPPAWADPDIVPTLSGEIVHGEAAPPLVGMASLTCATPSSGQGSYQVFGLAEGPYPGTFEESGTFKFDGGLITEFHATFEIQSGATQINGTKDLQITGGAACVDLAGSDRLDAPSFLTRYQATITSSLGMLTDHGVAIVGVVVQNDTLATVNEEFRSDREFSRVLVTPVESFNPVATTHTVTVTVTDDALQPIQSAHVLITVAGSVSETGQCTTGVDGTCQFTYLGPTAPGADLITACYDFDNDNTIDPGETCGAPASKAWVPDTSTPGSASGGGYIATPEGNRIVFGFGAEDSQAGPSGGCNVFDTSTSVHIRCLGVSVLAITGTHATIHGEAIHDGSATNYLIEVDDLGDPGTLDTFSIRTDSGFVAAGVLEAGNIRVTPRL